ncbi:hypothetical protein [Paracoccus sp. SCSIO 75233]|uniref:hypothetical protein n=1 Tax=Paracoccus sp. SCSIO 75233 TaxID=3017782 RepID=UPI0022F0A27A|nr:hypothetical protein [Paracoccus sp. SCSIO 75233]WBU53175.1 hypothetical protein PAF12_15370 [Paracoccus sp. SCSIO 75233]
MIGIGLSVLWLGMLLVLWLFSGNGTQGPGRWVSIVAAVMPLALIWIAVGLARAVNELREEAASLREEIGRSALRVPAPQEQRAPQIPSAQMPARPRPAAPTQNNPASTQRAAAAKPAGPSQPPQSPAEVPSDPRQHSFSLDAPEAVELAPQTLIRALNFPDGPDDVEAVAALRETLRDPAQARLIRSAQDVVTLLADRGIYTDELELEPASPAAWRRFSDGQRGKAVADVGAVRDPEIIAAAVEAMRGDDVFRDAVHHFLRLFDRSVMMLLPQLSDDEIVWMSDTRSARAFMLLARAAGLFGQEN